MPLVLTDLRDLAMLGFDEVIDVRAPQEFSEDHVPGALSLPVLSDAERARVGTIYVQHDRFLARKIGAALVARNAARHLEETLANRDGAWRPLVYCWRGGQRSNSFVSILQQIGWRAETLDGGYRAYRRLVANTLYEHPLRCRVIVVDGGTGTGKTRLLWHLAQAGAQVLDLEEMAGHRGSLFGGEYHAQPSQKRFESQLAGKIAQLNPDRPVFVEAESPRIGRINLPPAMTAAMRGGEVLHLTAPLEARVAHLMVSYQDLINDLARLETLLGALVRFHGHAAVDRWRGFVAEGKHDALIAELVTQHYDPRYRRMAPQTPVQEVPLPDLSDSTLATLARDLVSQEA